MQKSSFSHLCDECLTASYGSRNCISAALPVRTSLLCTSKHDDVIP